MAGDFDSFKTLFCFLFHSHTRSCPPSPPILHAVPFMSSLLRDNWNVSSPWEGHFNFLPFFYPPGLVSFPFLQTLHTFYSLPSFWFSAPVSLASHMQSKPKERQHSWETLLSVFHTERAFFPLLSAPARLIGKHSRQYSSFNLWKKQILIFLPWLMSLPLAQQLSALHYAVVSGAG